MNDSLLHKKLLTKTETKNNDSRMYIEGISSRTQHI